MNEIALVEFEIKYELPKVNYDLSKYKKQIKELKEKYEKKPITKDDVPVTKKEIARLNKFSKAVNDRKIEITKKIKEPITTFESEIKELCKDIDDVSKGLSTKVKIFTDKVIEDKKKEILALDEWVSEYMAFDESWLAVAYTIAKVKVDLAKQNNDFQNHSLLITTTCKSLGLDEVKYLELLMKRQEIEYIVDLINNDYNIKETYSNAPTVEKVVSAPTITIEDVKDEDVYTFTLQFTGTRTQLKLLKEYMNENNIKYEKV